MSNDVGGGRSRDHLHFWDVAVSRNLRRQWAEGRWRRRKAN